MSCEGRFVDVDVPMSMSMSVWMSRRICRCRCMSMSECTYTYICIYMYIYIERDIKAEQHECKRTYNASQIPRALRHVGASNLHLRTEVFTGSGENKRHAEPVHGMQFSDRGRPSSRRGLAPWKPRIFDFGGFSPKHKIKNEYEAIFYK